MVPPNSFARDTWEDVANGFRLLGFGGTFKGLFTHHQQSKHVSH